jgi:hypothetical protein
MAMVYISLGLQFILFLQKKLVQLWKKDFLKIEHYWEVLISFPGPLRLMIPRFTDHLFIVLNGSDSILKIIVRCSHKKKLNVQLLDTQDMITDDLQQSARIHPSEF